MTPVPNSELAARFVFSKSYMRSDGTVKAAAFLPRGDDGLSVTLRGRLSETELWDIGRDVGVETGRGLRGRADVRVGVVRKERLEIERAPTASNPEHAEIVGWPANIAARQRAAQQLANEATAYDA
jgi:hypothetical protein